jgi:hypothetical protein
LYKATKGEERESLIWESEQQQAFCAIEVLVSNHALGLPDVRKSFLLYVHEKSSIAIGVLTQYLDSWHWLVAYLSKQLDLVAKGWSPCLSALAATALLVSEAEMLALGGEISVQVPHSVMTLMEYK